MKYVAYLIQKGEGCDYTIGCGLAVRELSADNMEDAKQELKEIINEQYSGYETELENAIIYEVSNSFNVDLAAIKAEEEKSQQEVIDEEERIKDYKKFLELKKKFEDE